MFQYHRVGDNTSTVYGGSVDNKQAIQQFYTLAKQSPVKLHVTLRDAREISFLVSLPRGCKVIYDDENDDKSRLFHQIKIDLQFLYEITSQMKIENELLKKDLAAEAFRFREMEKCFYEDIQIVQSKPDDESLLVAGKKYPTVVRQKCNTRALPRDFELMTLKLDDDNVRRERFEELQSIFMHHDRAFLDYIRNLQDGYYKNVQKMKETVTNQVYSRPANSTLNHWFTFEELTRKQQIELSALTLLNQFRASIDVVERSVSDLLSKAQYYVDTLKPWLVHPTYDNITNDTSLQLSQLPIVTNLSASSSESTLDVQPPPQQLSSSTTTPTLSTSPSESTPSVQQSPQQLFSSTTPTVGQQQQPQQTSVGVPTQDVQQPLQQALSSAPTQVDQQTPPPQASMLSNQPVAVSNVNVGSDSSSNITLPSPQPPSALGSNLLVETASLSTVETHPLFSFSDPFQHNFRTLVETTVEEAEKYFKLIDHECIEQSGDVIVQYLTLLRRDFVEVLKSFAEKKKSFEDAAAKALRVVYQDYLLHRSYIVKEKEGDAQTVINFYYDKDNSEAGILPLLFSFLPESQKESFENWIFATFIQSYMNLVDYYEKNPPVFDPIETKEYNLEDSLQSICKIQFHGRTFLQTLDEDAFQGNSNTLFVETNVGIVKIGPLREKATNYVKNTDLLLLDIQGRYKKAWSHYTVDFIQREWTVEPRQIIAYIKGIFAALTYAESEKAVSHGWTKHMTMFNSLKHFLLLNKIYTLVNYSAEPSWLNPQQVNYVRKSVDNDLSLVQICKREVTNVYYRQSRKSIVTDDKGIFQTALPVFIAAEPNPEDYLEMKSIIQSYIYTITSTGKQEKTYSSTLQDSLYQWRMRQNNFAIVVGPKALIDEQSLIDIGFPTDIEKEVTVDGISFDIISTVYTKYLAYIGNKGKTEKQLLDEISAKLSDGATNETYKDTVVKNIEVEIVERFTLLDRAVFGGSPNKEKASFTIKEMFEALKNLFLLQRYFSRTIKNIVASSFWVHDLTLSEKRYSLLVTSFSNHCEEIAKKVSKASGSGETFILLKHAIFAKLFLTDMIITDDADSPTLPKWRLMNLVFKDVERFYRFMRTRLYVVVPNDLDANSEIFMLSIPDVSMKKILASSPLTDFYNDNELKIREIMLEDIQNIVTKDNMTSEDLITVANFWAKYAVDDKFREIFQSIEELKPVFQSMEQIAKKHKILRPQIIPAASMNENSSRDAMIQKGALLKSLGDLKKKVNNQYDIWAKPVVTERSDVVKTQLLASIYRFQNAKKKYEDAYSKEEDYDSNASFLLLSDDKEKHKIMMELYNKTKENATADQNGKYVKNNDFIVKSLETRGYSQYDTEDSNSVVSSEDTEWNKKDNSKQKQEEAEFKREEEEQEDNQEDPFDNGDIV